MDIKKTMLDLTSCRKHIIINISDLYNNTEKIQTISH